ncbi:MAG: MFS transporter [Candidatus Competibacteraceae bacterium]|nr:MFS transporter [Candidatus Competibacteraceae bacterium]
MLSIAGYISDLLWVKTGSMRIARSHMIWICQLLSAISFVPILYSPSFEWAIFFLSLGLGFGLMPNASFYAINTDLAKDKAATSLGLMDSFPGPGRHNCPLHDRSSGRKNQELQFSLHAAHFLHPGGSAGCSRYAKP